MKIIPTRTEKTFSAFTALLLICTVLHAAETNSLPAVTATNPPALPTRTEVQPDENGKWVDLLPAADLKNWTRVAIPPTKPLGRAQWHLDADRQVLVCDGDGGHEMLRFDRELTNCIFHVECRFIPVTEPKPKYNSGIFIRNSADGVIWHQCQLTMDGGYLFGETPDGDQRKHFKSPASEKRMKAAGEWNTVAVTAIGHVLTVEFNGVEVAKFTECGNLSGYIALESEGYAIEFRNLKLKELASTAASSTEKLAASPAAREFHDLAYLPNGTERQKLDLYLPEPSDVPSPLIVWIHGGGWQAGNKDNCLADILPSCGIRKRRGNEYWTLAPTTAPNTKSQSRHKAEV